MNYQITLMGDKVLEILGLSKLEKSYQIINQRMMEINPLYKQKFEESTTIIKDVEQEFQELYIKLRVKNTSLLCWRDKKNHTDFRSGRCG